jgi:SNF2 family DNA or RNA helicase
MKILHGTWIPQAENGFIQTGAFYLWVETTESKKPRSKGKLIHPRQLAKPELESFLTDELGIQIVSQKSEAAISPKCFLLPSAADQPLPSLELSRYLEADTPEKFDFQYWQIDCYKAIASIKTGTHHYTQVSNVINLLNDLHFIALHNLAEVQLGADLLFWYHYTQFLKQIILTDQYVPALKYRAISTAEAKTSATKRSTQTKQAAQAKQTGATKSVKTTPTRSKRAAGSNGAKRSTQAEPSAQSKPTGSKFEIYPAWEIVSEQYETEVQRYVEYMPLVCVAGFEAIPDQSKQSKFYAKETLLRHFSECLLTDIVTHTPSTSAFDQKIFDSLIYSCLYLHKSGTPWTSAIALEQYQQWQVWSDRLRRTQTETPFHLYFQLHSPAKAEDKWQLQFQVAPKQDPSLKISLLDYWRSRSSQQKELQKQFGKDFEQNLLLNLGYAARVYPKLWQGLETNEPESAFLTTDEVVEFLRESAWVLEAAGYKVIVPAWWTPKGRQRAKVRLKAAGRKPAGDKKSQSYFSFETLVEYEYELAIGDQKISEKEWRQLVEAKSPLVQFRGQWVELDQQKMQQMLEFWQTQQKENPEMSLLDLMKLTADSEDDLELDLDRDQLLSEMLEKLNDKSRLEPMPDPAGLNGTLREYQKRGVSWLYYLENLGLNGCLADDMGLGKTVQVIARLIQERELAEQEGRAVPPTLLVAPTSVLGNWHKEIEKFAPRLRALVHHGNQRLQTEDEFKATCLDHDVVITSFTLARKDAKLLNEVDWHRLVLDEAQNIKNPKAVQTKAILKLSANHRLALTGTPVENRLLDLWSIFNFLNPGYLGKEAQFRKGFEIPIQKNNDVTRSATLKKLVEPFILRRVKTDQSIIKDLPDKVEQKLFCNLTKEQASLYEATVKDVEKQLQEAEGIQRKGLILSTLMKLKQICNHPMQFLQDSSEFTPERSHKLTRLSEMITEVMEEGESLLVFTQFTEIGEALEKYLKQTLHYNTYYIHGGTNRNKREKMIAEFQDPETEPSVFILSLKAGGVGITLTKANHVFHFDRWWNPAVEDQATDRAFRIGQKKNVFVHKFVAIGTLEERIDQMIEDKKKLAGAIVGADESWLTELDNDAFKKLISLNQSAILE